MNTFKLSPTQNFPLERSSATFLGLFCALGLSLFSSTTAFAQEIVQRDQQALTVLAQTIKAGGGRDLLTSIQDLTETGTITYSGATQVTGSVTVKSRGLHQFKIDADLADGKRTMVVNGERGSLKELDGKSWPIHRQSAVDLGSLTLPYLTLIGAMQDSSVSIIYGGLATHNGASTYSIRFQQIYPKQQDPNGDRGVREARDFYIDPKTFLISAISDRIHHRVGPNDQGDPHENLYSNYQAENGVMTPLTIVATSRGVTGFTLSLTQVTFNVGSSDGDFAW